VLGETPGTDPDASGMRYQPQTTTYRGPEAQSLQLLVPFTKSHFGEVLCGTARARLPQPSLAACDRSVQGTDPGRAPRVEA
jgi:hypothetical protein